MKQLACLLFATLCLAAGNTIAQKAHINIIANGCKETVGVFDPAVNYDPKKFISIISLDKNGAGIYNADLSNPRYITLYFTLPGAMSPRYSLYLSPGDDLLFQIKFINNTPVISVTGKGSNNNQPAIFALTNIDLYKFKEDKLPYRAITAIKTQEALNDATLKQYIRQYKPSVAFIENARLNCNYFSTSAFYEFYHNKLRFATDPGYLKWQNIEDSLLRIHPVNYDGALTAFNYEHLIDCFMNQEPPFIMNQAVGQQAAGFYKKWYHTTVNKGKKTYTAEERNLFIERVINAFFSGKTAELAYADMIRFHLRFNHYEGLDLVFNHFKQKYPDSRYIPAFNIAMAEIAAKKAQTLNNNMLFVMDNGARLNTLEDVIRLMKGKTVVVDMWGTWCSPCREELEKYSPQIRDRFKGKNVTFLYIDNKDKGHEKAWKQVIAYYKIYGTHILANENLDEDIMHKIKSTGYPTHFIIRKDGSFKKMTTQDESQTGQVIKEIAAEL